MNGGPGQGRNVLELIPGKNKTVLFDQPPINYVLGGLIPLAIGIFLLWFIPEMVRQSLMKHDQTGVVMAVGIGGLFAGLLTFVGMLMLYVALDGGCCLSLKALSDRFCVSHERLIEVARAENIRPRYNLSGLNVYRRGAFRSLRDPTTIGAPRPLAVRVGDVVSDNRAEFILAGAVLLAVFGMAPHLMRATPPAANSPRVFFSPRKHKRIILPPENPEASEPVVGNPQWRPEPHSGF